MQPINDIAPEPPKPDHFTLIAKPIKWVNPEVQPLEYHDVVHFEPRDGIYHIVTRDGTRHAFAISPYLVTITAHYG